jgi:hypothetical protein
MSQPSRPFRRITVTVRRDDYATWLPFTTGVVLVDSRRVGFLIGGRTRTFHVAPGEHTIGVVLGGLGYLETRLLRMEEGDRVDLVCGSKTRRVKRMTPVMALLMLVTCLLAGALILSQTASGPGRLLGPFPTGASAVVVYPVSALWIAVLLRWGPTSAPCYLRRNSLKKKALVADL